MKGNEMEIKEYKFSKLEAIRHIEKVNGKRLIGFSTGSAYYTGQPRVHWCFENEKAEWDNPELFGHGIKSLFFPNGNVMSMKVNIYSETFEFIVRE